ncbi:MAG TPA: hypothetical protein VGE51_03915 [Fontimonas sp.]
MNASTSWLALFLTALLSACASTPDVAVAACSDQCLSHTDGYEWAQRSNLTDTAACSGYPAAFVEGCRNGVEDFRQLQPSSKGI